MIPFAMKIPVEIGSWLARSWGGSGALQQITNFQDK